MKFKSTEKNLIAPPVGRRQGLWTSEEHEKMFKFLQMNKQNLIDHLRINLIDGTRRNKRQFFINMAEFISTKDEKQCKSRYQKQERSFLKALKLPQQLLERFEEKRKTKVETKAETKERRHLKSAQTTEDAESVDKLDDSKSQISIHTYDDLRASLSMNFLPRIQNEILKHQMEKFLRGLSNEDQIPDDLPSLNLNSLSIILPQFGLSTSNYRDKDCSFIDEFA